MAAARHRQARRSDVPRHRRRGAPRRSASRASGTPARSIRWRPACCRCVVGRATRLAQFLTDATTRATKPTIRFGSATDTLRCRAASGSAGRGGPIRGDRRRRRAPRWSASAAAACRRRPPIRRRRSAARSRVRSGAARTSAVALAPVTGARCRALDADRGSSARRSPTCCVSASLAAGFYVRSPRRTISASALGMRRAPRRAAAHRERRVHAGPGHWRSIGRSTRPRSRRADAAGRAHGGHACRDAPGRTDPRRAATSQRVPPRPAICRLGVG